MARYLLQKPWALRGFLNAPYVLLDPTGSIMRPVRVLNEVLFTALLKCDGQTDCTEDKALRALEKNGLIALVPPENDGLSQEQCYRLFPFEQKHTAQISITGRCNLNCLHCFMAADKERATANDDLTCEQLLGMVDQLPACGVTQVELTGGEPLISPYFRNMVQRLSQRHLALTRVLTNGLVVDDALFDFLLSQGQKPEIVISFDGLGTHDRMRNHPHAEEAALAAMRRTVAHGFPLRCTVQVNRLSFPRLIETCRYLKELGAGSLYLIRTMETPRWAGNAWVDESLPVPAYYDACCTLAETMIHEQWNIPLNVFNGFNLRFDPTPKLSFPLPYDENENCMHRCGRAAHSFFITHNGRVLPCDAFEGIGAAGGILEEKTLKDAPLAELLGSSIYASLERTTLLDIKNANKECQSCSIFPECGGGCRAVGFGGNQFFGDGHAKGQGQQKQRAFTTCAYYRGGYETRIRTLTERRKKPYTATTKSAK